MGQVDASAAGEQIFLMQDAHSLHLSLQGGDERVWHGRDTVLFAFAVADQDGFILKIQVFEPQACAFHQPQSRSIQDLRHQFELTAQMREDGRHLFAGQHGRQAFRTFGTRRQDRLELLMQDFAVQEQDGTGCLIPPAPTAGAVWVEAATLRSSARCARNSRISSTPMEAGWRFL